MNKQSNPTLQEIKGFFCISALRSTKKPLKRVGKCQKNI